MAAIKVEAMRKNVEKTSPIPAIKGAADNPAGAASPTPIMARANAGRAWANELLLAQLNPPDVITRPIKFPSMRKARTPMARKARMVSALQTPSSNNFNL